MPFKEIFTCILFVHQITMIRFRQTRTQKVNSMLNALPSK
jgi:hypothetical protein